MSEVPTFSEPERAAMRAYLQRCEVRISTLHRVATAFISGAGLLLLIPVFFKDAIDSIIEILLLNAVNQYPNLMGIDGEILTVLLYLLIGYPLFLSLAIPVYGLYLLFKDIVHFYFAVNVPGYPKELLNPTFSLSSVSFSSDESPHVKRAVMRYQYQPVAMDYTIPFSHGKRALYFEGMIHNTDGLIIPPERAFERLQAEGILSETANPEDVNHFNAALGLARSLDRTLAEEVAVTEMTLTRLVLYLRRLVLRYIKTLLMFVWTMFVAFMMLPFMAHEGAPVFLVLSVSYFIWSLAVLYIIGFPIRWIYRYLQSEKPMEHIDPQLTLMERNIRQYTYAAILTSALAILMSALIYME